MFKQVLNTEGSTSLERDAKVCPLESNRDVTGKLSPGNRERTVIGELGSRIHDQGSRILDQGSRTINPGSRTLDPDQ